MNRQELIEGITAKLEHLDDETLEGLGVLVARLEPTLSASGFPYTGDPDTDEVLDDPETVQRLMKHRRGETKSRPLREIMADLGDNA